MHAPFIDRDVSWLSFNDHVLNEAMREDTPLLERLKFLSIASGNLDEFFMIRMSSVVRRIKKNPFDQEKKENFQTILKHLHSFLSRQEKVFSELVQALFGKGLVFLNPKDVLESENAKKWFVEVVLPSLKIETQKNVLKEVLNLQTFAVMGEKIVLIPKEVPEVFVQKKENTVEVFFLQHLLEVFLPVFLQVPGEVHLVRLTRDGDVKVEWGEMTAIPDQVRTELKMRDKGPALRLQTHKKLKASVKYQLLKVFNLQPEQVFVSPHLHLHFLKNVFSQIKDKCQADLVYPKFNPYKGETFYKNKNVFDRLDAQDFMMHHPYDSFNSYNEWVRAATKDENVVSIEQTIYRVDALSSFIEDLKLAAKTKKVRVFIELRARFDEMNNLKLSEELRNAGVEVYFGFGKLKLHAKVALVKRKVGGKIKYYTHLSTGNYNQATSRQYVDMGMLTSNENIGKDAEHFFETLVKKEIPKSFSTLIMAPTALHTTLQKYIDGEVKAALKGERAHIIAKVNALVDEKIAKKLYEASQKGVQVDLIVRGACCIRPQVKDLSENIRVISLVDRFLEHSRIYYFKSSKKVFLSSADWMPRNFFSRLEIAFPVLDEKLYDFIEHTVLPSYLFDTERSKELSGNGKWAQRSPESLKKLEMFVQKPKNAPEPFRAQAFFISLAEKKYAGSALSLRKGK